MPKHVEISEQNTDPHRGVCAQDFETTIQPYFSAQWLRGSLNFSALWNPITYVYDTAIGDNPNLLNSYWSMPRSPEHALYATFRAFIESGVVRCLVRDKVSIAGSTIATDPKIAELYLGWRLRDEKSPDKFLTQEFGRKRDLYYEHIDRLLFEDFPGAVKRYDPDRAKPHFRDMVRQEIVDRGPLWKLVRRLPPEIQYEYEKTCAEREFMTTADLWALVKGCAHQNPAARTLVLRQGYINQQAIADSISCGVTGSDWEGAWRPSPHPCDAVADSARGEDDTALTLDAPAIELLAQLSPEDIQALREVGKDRFFTLSVPNGTDDDAVRRITSKAMRDYWKHICAVLETRFPDQTHTKGRVLAFFEDRVPKSKHLLRRHPWVKNKMSLIVTAAVSFCAPLSGEVALEFSKRPLKWIAYRLFYSPTPALRSLQRINSSLWIPRAAWTTSPVDAQLAASGDAAALQRPHR